MPHMPNDPTPEPASCWVLTDGKAGDEAQCIGVAEAIGVPFEVRQVHPRPPFSWIMPRGPIDPGESETSPGSPIAPPFPDVLIASGRRAVAYLKRVKKASGGRTFTVFLKDPRTGPDTADFIWVPEHDRLRGRNVLVTPTSPHRFSAGKLAALRDRVPHVLAALPHPRVAVLVGGDSRHHSFTSEDIDCFCDGLRSLADTANASLLMTCSRRTPQQLRQRLEQLAASGSSLLWDEQGENPLPLYLAMADAIIATADSTNMIGEAAATGKPIHVFHPNGGHPKIDRFLGKLEGMGIIHPFPGPLKNTTYDPLDSTPLIARRIREAFAER
jgi:mitochondrial fission protein ELM1